jgi:hypothetical protein
VIVTLEANAKLAGDSESKLLFIEACLFDGLITRYPDHPIPQNAPSCVKLKPGKETPSADLATLTLTTGASGAVTSAGRRTAYCVNTSL